MANDYLWDRAGTPDLDIKWLEDLLAPLAHEAPLDELRLAKGRRDDLVRATAQEPVEATPTSRRKGNMNIFDKRIVGAATLTAAALGLLGVSVYNKHGDVRAPPPWQPPMIALAPSFALAPHAAPLAPTTGADLAISAGGSAKIHVPFGTVDVEIHSSCNAEVVMSVVTYMMGPRAELPGSSAVAGPASGSHALGGDPIIAGTDSADGRVSRYHLAAGIEPMGMVQYTARCVGQPPLHGVLEIDREDGHGPVGPITNARVFDDTTEMGTTEYALAHGIHVFGSVLPGATVSVDGVRVALEPPHAGSKDDPIVSQEFRIDGKITADHPVVAVRVDDAHGAQFYVSRRTVAGSGASACTTKMLEPKQTAADLDAQGDPAGALRTIKTVIAACKPDRDTLSVALAYACKAGDAAAARDYWHELPPELQRTLESVCAEHALTRDKLDAP